MELDQYQNCTQASPGIGQVSYMLIKYEEELQISLISRGIPEYKYLRKILSDTTLIMLERTMYLAIILLLVKYRFQIHWSDGKDNARVRTVN